MMGVRFAYALLVGSHISLSQAARAVSNDAPKANDGPPAWKLVEDHAFCSKAVRKDLGTVTSVDECTTRALGDPDCGHQVSSNGEDTCYCVKAGEECDMKESKADSAVYQKEVRVVDVTWAANSQAFEAAGARCCCNKHSGWKDHLRKETGICIIVRDTDTCSKSGKRAAKSSSYLAELKKKTMHHHPDTDDKLCEIPEDHVQDILDEFGPPGCGAAEVQGENGLVAQVEFTKFGETADVTCPFGTSTAASVTCGSDGKFDPEPGCHGE